ncbi:MAG: glycine-rich protein, partial [Bacteroidota bacterium]
MKRKIYNLMSGARQGLFVLALFVSGTALSQVSYSFAYTGAVQTLTLSAGAWGIQSWGANGGDAGAGAGGVGAYSFGAFNVAVAGTQINILVGGKGTNGGAAMGSGGAGGWNGGGGGGACGKTGGGGGGGTDVRVGGIAATNRIIVAGGGGGASFYDQGAAGGNGGGQTAGNGNFITMGNVLTIGGGGAGAVGGTPGASNPFWASSDGTATGGGGGGNSPGLAGVGQQGTGGGAGGAGAILGGGLTGGSGGGGGGYAGGAGGSQTVNAGIGGGGGSGFVTGLINGITVSTGQPGFVSNPDITGNGYLIITAICGITLSAMGGNPICAGNSATLITNAASNYAWSNGGNFSSTVVSPTITTTYTVIGSNGSCTNTRTVTLQVSPIPTVTAISNPTVLCSGSTATLTTSGASTYTWNPGALTGATIAVTPTATTIYSV